MFSHACCNLTELSEWNRWQNSNSNSAIHFKGEIEEFDYDPSLPRNLCGLFAVQLVQGLILFQGKTFPKLLVNVEHTVLELLLVTWTNYSAKFHTMGERRPQWQEGPSCQMGEVRKKTQCWHEGKTKNCLNFFWECRKLHNCFTIC